jgi:hypothetical protein
LILARVIVAKGVADKVIDSNEVGTLPQDDARPWERYFLAYDPASTLASLKVPVLALMAHWMCRFPHEKILPPLAKPLRAIQKLR